MLECGNPLQVTYAETWQSDPIHIPQSQTQEHHQDHTFKS